MVSVGDEYSVPKSQLVTLTGGIETGIVSGEV